MTDLSPILPKLSRLVPRLASDMDGEIVATVRAIDRTLRAAGADWHDLTAALTAPDRLQPEPPLSDDVRGQGDPERDGRISQARARVAACARRGRELSEKERAFLRTILAGLDRGWQLSKKQARWLDDIHDRLGGVA